MSTLSIAHRGRRATSRIATVFALILLSVAVPSVSSAASGGSLTELIPEIAGTTTVTFNGTSGIRLHVPKDVTLTASDFTFNLEGGDAAFGLLSPLDADRCRAGYLNDPGQRPPEQWCTDYSFHIMKGWFQSPFIFDPPEDPRLQTGRIDIHVVTAGRLTMTFTVPELDGAVSYRATGEMDGDIVATPPTCLGQVATGCDKQAWGGQVFRDIPAMTIVGSAVFSQRSDAYLAGGLAPGSVAAGSCLYPNVWNPDKSADPADHPHGCDADEEGPITWRTTYLVMATANPTVPSSAQLRTDLFVEPADEVYTGFLAHQFESAEPIDGPGQFSAFSYWYSREIRCPSGNWVSCDR